MLATVYQAGRPPRQVSRWAPPSRRRTATAAKPTAPAKPDRGGYIFAQCLAANEPRLGIELLRTNAPAAEVDRRLEQARLIRSHAVLAAQLGVHVDAQQIEAAIVAGVDPGQFGRQIIAELADRQAASEIRSVHAAGDGGPDANASWKASIAKANKR